MRWSRVFLKGQRDHQSASGRPSALFSRGPGRVQVGARGRAATAVPGPRVRLETLGGNDCTQVTATWKRSVAGLGKKKKAKKKKACKTLPSKNKGLQISLFLLSRNKNTLAMAIEFPQVRGRC